MSDNALVKVTDLYKHYKGGEIKALDGVSIDVNKGEVIVSRRPSGLRKTTVWCNSLAHRTTWLRSDLLTFISTTKVAKSRL